MNKAWMYVGMTCIFELMWVYGFNTAVTWWEWGMVIAIIFTDFHILPKACESLPTGTVYSVFAGVGTIGTVLMDIFLFGGSMNTLKLLFMAFIVIGVIGLNLADHREEHKEVRKEVA
ncbi:MULTISPECIES: DMT family transporter [Bacillaceae]|uniref:DMT family transporter n=1 Tax=Bacillaceae TaxID=186817 RepID=UPI002FFFFEFA